MSMSFLDLTGPKTKPGSIYNWVNYKKIPVEIVLEDAQALIYSRLRVREMRVSSPTLSLAIGQSTIALPTGFLEPIVLRDRVGIALIPNQYDRDSFVTDAVLVEKRSYDADTGALNSGIPCAVAIFDEMYQFDMQASEARTYDHIFYQRPSLLSPSNNTNFLTVRYPHIVRIACLAGAASYMKDDAEEAKQLAKLMPMLDAANAEADLLRVS